MTKTKEYREQLAETFLQVLEEKQLDWKTEWQSSRGQNPLNVKTGNHYRGINRLYLMLVAMQRGYKDHRWATFKQIQDQGWHLKDAKGQGIKVEYWFPFDTEDKKALTWQQFRQLQKTGAKFGERYQLRAKYATVFNGALIDGIPELSEQEEKVIEPDELIHTLSKNMKVEILHDGGDRAFYRPTEDKIHMPLSQHFDSPYAYGSTALHELAHATGAAHRLNRNIQNMFGTEDYAYEELIAEISSCFMSVNLQMEQSEEHVENHKAYVQSWAQGIREKPEILVKAVQQAEKAATYMEYKAELLAKEEYMKNMDSSMEVDSNVVIEQEYTLERKMPEQNVYEKNKLEEDEMSKTVEQEIGEIRDMLTEIQKDIRFFKDFMQEHQIPEMGLEEKRNGIQKSEQKELSLRL